MRIGSIDPAIKNVGCAVICSDTKNILHLKKVNMLQPSCINEGEVWKYSRAIIPRMCKQFIEDNMELFESCDFIVIESQMQSKFIQISLVLESLLLSICPTFIIHPIHVKKYFNIATGNYTQNKKASVALCKQILHEQEWQKNRTNS
jgi:hypothetical protein